VSSEIYQIGDNQPHLLVGAVISLPLDDGLGKSKLFCNHNQIESWHPQVITLHAQALRCHLGWRPSLGLKAVIKLFKRHNDS
jgi:hypothetical protein